MHRSGPLDKANRPSRVVLNFTHRCSLNCEWCYVPFGSPKAKRDTVLAVVSRVVELGFTSITLGGGDPFQYSFVGDVVRLADQLGLNVHLDTHARSLRHTRANAELITECVDLIGLPLDGASAAIHDRMRGYIGHFDIVVQRLGWLKGLGTRVKINTMISSQNVSELPELARLVRTLAPWGWSIYQFWPLGPAQAVAVRHEASAEEFAVRAEEASIIASSAGTTVVEVSKQLRRRSTYPLIYHDGSINVHSGNEVNSLVCIGSIFDADARQKIDDRCGAERIEAKPRYTR
ncbi:radical SAM protein [Pseudomonas sp. xss_1]|uniref:radical SAM protein n=1 Tax=Pseudomonas sp. xss_1 TaxID=3367214 RepID=UPI00370A2D27